MACQPRINSTLVAAIRMAKLSRSITSGGTQIVYRFLHNQDRPDKPFTTERAQRAGMANAASGRIFVTAPKDHFGPIPAENDPERNQGVLVGETWGMRMDCRQWGVHYPPVGGISGKAHYGSQSVVISGGYEDDEDNGEWFIYTGRLVCCNYIVIFLLYLFLCYALLFISIFFKDLTLQIDVDPMPQ